jgi:hypothetical protein
MPICPIQFCQRGQLRSESVVPGSGNGEVLTVKHVDVERHEAGEFGGRCSKAGDKQNLYLCTFKYKW